MDSARVLAAVSPGDGCSGIVIYERGEREQHCLTPVEFLVTCEIPTGASAQIPLSILTEGEILGRKFMNSDKNKTL